MENKSSTYVYTIYPFMHSSFSLDKKCCLKWKFFVLKYREPETRCFNSQSRTYRHNKSVFCTVFRGGPGVGEGIRWDLHVVQSLLTPSSVLDALLLKKSTYFHTCKISFGRRVIQLKKSGPISFFLFLSTCSLHSFFFTF